MATQPSRNAQAAAIYLLADELSVPPRTVAWIDGAIGVLGRREPEHQVEPRELCAGLIRDLNECYHGDIEAGLRETKLASSDDVGRIVWALISKGLIRANPNDRAADFAGIFHIDQIDLFLASAGIQRRRISWTNTKRYLSWALYLVGIVVVTLSYAKIVSSKTAWLGWTIGMAGFALAYIPVPKPKRF